MNPNPNPNPDPNPNPNLTLTLTKERKPKAPKASDGAGAAGAAGGGLGVGSPTQALNSPGGMAPLRPVPTLQRSLSMQNAAGMVGMHHQGDGNGVG